MGAKRPLQEDDFPELSFKLPKQLDSDKKLALKTDEFPSRRTTLIVDSPGVAERNFCQLQFDEKLEDSDIIAAFTADKELEGSTPLSFVTSSSSEEDSENEDSFFLSNFPSPVDFGLPREQFADPYISMLNCSPRKEVPVGPDHQADVPCWDPNTNVKRFSGFSYSVDPNRDQELMGTCIIPMPVLNSSPLDEYGVGRGRKDCFCLDVGSLRCVQQHVREARDKLRETLGEKFLDLGFLDMGDNVACKWSADEERVFSEVIFCNPLSHGKDFWKQHSLAFPTRTKMELVSYYFNVFILRRRAIQNRSSLLGIDSDNDEDRSETHRHFYHNISYLSSNPNTDDEDDYSVSPSAHGGFYLVNGEDENFGFESFGDRIFYDSWVEDDCWSEHERAFSAEVSDGNHGMSDSKGDDSNKGNHGISDSNTDEADGLELDGGPSQSSSRLVTREV